MNRGEPVAYIWRNPFRVVKTRRFQPRVASVLAGLANTRQPWALRRNPFGIRGLRFMVTMHMRSERRLSMNRRLVASRSLVGESIWLAGALVPLTPTLSPRRAVDRFL